MRTQFAIVTLFLAAGLAAGPTAAELPILSAVLYAADEEAAAADEPYRAGKRALDQHRWAEAAGLFAESAASGADNADAAHYWQAYALHKDGRSPAALDVLGELRRAYPDSSWLDDASALGIEIREGSGGAGAGESDPDEELKLLALNSLMHSDSDRAMPMLSKFIAGDHSPELKERALFVLSQSDSPEAGRMLLEVARGNQHRELQMKAIHYLGISDAPGHAAALEEIYGSTTDKEIKEQVLHSFMISDAHEPLLRVARSEPDVEMRRAAIHQLGVMDAHDALRELYSSESSVEVKGEILHSMFISDDTDFLTQVARTETDSGLRRAAIRSLGLVDSRAATAVLGEIYGESADKETREAILEALFLSDDSTELIRIARTETDPQLRKEAFQKLSLMDDDAAIDFMMEILDR